jgi:phosphoribosylaminoimidazolecarboxamide formyltransferase/IMP cyclohydrolase
MSSPIRQALLSVSDKDGIVELARALAHHGIGILSTGGTARSLTAAGLAVTEVADYTGFPEIMEGRVKTLHPRIHGGLLGRRGIDDAIMRERAIDPIDLLVVNLYPFAATVSRPDVTEGQAIENIDVGGPAMIRAAAKNFESVVVVVDPADYGLVIEALNASGGVDRSTRRRLAAKAFAHTADYDAMIADWMRDSIEGTERSTPFPATLSLRLERIQLLRYGENPHQGAAFYREHSARSGDIARARMLQGKDLSFNNIADADTAIECVRAFAEPACVIVKHANPCGAALAETISEAYLRAYRTDPTSAFGGIIAFNRPLDAATAATILERQFVEVIAAPHIDAQARRALAARPSVRVLELEQLAERGDTLEYRSVAGGLLVQTRDRGAIAASDLEVVSERPPTATELIDLMFAWRVCKFVKSNAIVYARDRATVGVGAGQMSRVYSSRLAAMKAADEKLEVRGAVMASDAFFPFRDGLDVAAEHGIRAVIQPGGSKRDAEVVAAADEHDIAMVFTHMRHFRH